MALAIAVHFLLRSKQRQPTGYNPVGVRSELIPRIARAQVEARIAAAADPRHRPWHHHSRVRRRQRRHLELYRWSMCGCHTIGHSRRSLGNGTGCTWSHLRMILSAASARTHTTTAKVARLAECHVRRSSLLGKRRARIIACQATHCITRVTPAVESLARWACTVHSGYKCFRGEK